MAEAQVQTSVFTPNRGYATDLAPMTRGLDFLVRAENLTYEVNGSARKIGGETKINSTAITSSPDVVGMFDFWYSGGSSVATQKYVVVTGDGKVYKDDMDGTFDDITGAATISANTIPVFCQFNDLLTIWFSTGDAPLKWAQSGNVASLGGTPPVGRVATVYANRLWVAGVNSSPSRLYYSAYGDPETWTGEDAGALDIDTEDGDRITGLAAFKGALLVFKGPYKGTIYVVTGSAPTGTDSFGKHPLNRGIALQTHNSIVPVGDDLWFMSDQGIHSIQATDRFGDFANTYLSRFLRGHFRDKINRTRLNRVWGVNDTDRGQALWVYTASGSSENDRTLGLSYNRLEEDGLKALTWTRGGISAAMRINPGNSFREVVFGSTDGFCRREQVSDRSIDASTGYTFRLTTPQIILGNQDKEGRPKGDLPITLYDFYVRMHPRTTGDLTVNITRDNQASQSYTITHSTVGSLWGTGVFGTATFGGGTLQTGYVQDIGLSGQCRAVTIDLQQGGANQDVEVFEMGIKSVPAAETRAPTVL